MSPDETPDDVARLRPWIPRWHLGQAKRGAVDGHWSAEIEIDRGRVRLRRVSGDDDAGAASGTRHEVELRIEARGGTATAAMLAAHWVAWREPRAVVTFSTGGQGGMVRNRRAAPHCASAIRLISRDPGWVALLSCRREGPGFERGWVEPGEPLVGHEEDIWQVRHLHFRPTDVASPGRPCQWDASLLVARVPTFVAIGRRRLPRLCRELQRVAPYGGPIGGSWALRRSIAEAPTLDLYRDLLPDFLPRVAVARLPSPAVD